MLSSGEAPRLVSELHVIVPGPTPGLDVITLIAQSTSTFPLQLLSRASKHVESDVSPSIAAGFTAALVSMQSPIVPAGQPVVGKAGSPKLSLSRSVQVSHASPIPSPSVSV